MECQGLMAPLDAPALPSTWTADDPAGAVGLGRPESPHRCPRGTKRDLRLVDRAIVVKGQSKQERPARGACGELACARELQADGLPVHVRRLGQVRRVTKYAMLRIGSKGSTFGRGEAFSPQAPLGRGHQKRETGIEIAALSQLRIFELAVRQCKRARLGEF